MKIERVDRLLLTVEVVQHMKDCGIEILEGPVRQTGAIGTIVSIYVRDADGNFIGVSNYLNNSQGG
jgi:hypothetical protein